MKKKFFLLMMFFFISVKPAVAVAPIIPVVAYVIETGVPIAAELLFANTARTLLAPVVVGGVEAVAAGSTTSTISAVAQWVLGVTIVAQVGSISLGIDNAGQRRSYDLPVSSNIQPIKPTPPTNLSDPDTVEIYFQTQHLIDSSFYPNRRIPQEGDVGYKPMVDWMTPSKAIETANWYKSKMTAEGASQFASFFIEQNGTVFVNGQELPLYYIGISNQPGYYVYYGFTPRMYIPPELTDNKFRFMFSADFLEPDPDDPDWNNFGGNAIPHPLLSSNNGNETLFQGYDSKGNEILFKVFRVNNKTHVKQILQSGGNLIVDEFVLKADGTFESTSARTYKNTKAVDYYNLIESTVGPNDGTGTTQEIVFPDDYARELTLAKVAENTLATAQLLSNIGNAPPDPAAVSDDEIKALFFGDSFNDLRGWRLSNNVGQCPTLTFNIWLFQNPFVMNQHCALFEQHRDMFFLLFTLIWSMSAFFIVMRA